MQPNLIACNANSTDVMPHGTSQFVNSNDIMCGSCNMHVPVSWASLHNIDMPHSTYWPGMYMCWLLTTKINCLTFSGNNYPKCKPEHVHDGSHCIMQ